MTRVIPDGSAVNFRPSICNRGETPLARVNSIDNRAQSMKTFILVLKEHFGNVLWEVP